jgi:hypothetical protein
MKVLVALILTVSLYGAIIFNDINVTNRLYSQYEGASFKASLSTRFYMDNKFGYLYIKTNTIDGIFDSVSSGIVIKF